MSSTTLDFSFDDLSTVFSARYPPRCGLSSWKNNNRRNWKKQAFLFSPRARIASRPCSSISFLFHPIPHLPLRSDGGRFRRSRKSSATSREISRWMLKVPRNKSGSQCSGTTTMTNRRVRQVLPLLTIREGRSPRVLSVREINSLRNSRANFSSRRAKRFADIYTREYLSAR